MKSFLEILKPLVPSNKKRPLFLSDRFYFLYTDYCLFLEKMAFST